MKSEDSWGALGQHPLNNNSDNAFYMVTVYTAYTNLSSFKPQIQQVPTECLCQALGEALSHSVGAQV